jgi:hypothetical protein
MLLSKYFEESVVKFSAQSEHFLLSSLKKGLNISLILRTIYPSRITTFLCFQGGKVLQGDFIW